MGKEFNKEINDNGEKMTLNVTSSDDKEVNLGKNYILANNPNKKTNRLVEKYRGSVLNKDVGFKSTGFASMTLFAGIISIAVLLILYFIWRF